MGFRHEGKSGWLESRPRWAASGAAEVPTIAVRRDLDLPVTPSVGWSTYSPAPRQRTAVASLVQKGLLAGKPLTFRTSPRVTSPRGAQAARARYATEEDLAIAVQKKNTSVRSRPTSAGTLRLGRPKPVVPGRVIKPTLDTRNDGALRRQPKWSETARRQWEDAQKAAAADIALAGAGMKRGARQDHAARHARAIRATRERAATMQKVAHRTTPAPVWGHKAARVDTPKSPTAIPSANSRKIVSPAEDREKQVVSSVAKDWNTDAPNSDAILGSTGSYGHQPTLKKEAPMNIWEVVDPKAESVEPESDSKLEAMKPDPESKSEPVESRDELDSEPVEPEPEPEPESEPAEPAREPEPELESDQHPESASKPDLGHSPKPAVGHRSGSPIDLPCPSAVAANVLELAEWRRVKDGGRSGIADALRSKSAEELSLAGSTIPQRPGISVSISSKSFGASHSRSYDHLPGGFDQRTEQVEEKAHRRRYRQVEAEALAMLQDSEWELAVGEHIADGQQRLDLLQTRLEAVGSQLQQCVAQQHDIQVKYEGALQATEAKAAAVDAASIFLSKRYANRSGTGLQIMRPAMPSADRTPSASSALGTRITKNTAAAESVATRAMGRMSDRADKARARVRADAAEKQLVASTRAEGLMKFASGAFQEADAATLRRDREETAARQVEAEANKAAIQSGRGALAHTVRLDEIHNTMNEEEAAIRIQAHVRGRQTRNRTAALRSSMKQLYASEVDELDAIIAGGGAGRDAGGATYST